jgi:hypothetical protein
MDQRRIELRVVYLKQQISALEDQRATLTDVSQIRRAEDEILEKQGGVKELKQWGREIDLDPGYGNLVRCSDGTHRPKLPVFESREERTAALDNMEGTISGMSASDVLRAREQNARDGAEVSIRNMDGRSPYISEEERSEPRGTL